MKKRLSVLVALLLITLGLTACGGNKAYTPDTLREAITKKKDVKDKTVKFEVTDISKDKTTGVELYSGKNMSFVEKSGKDPKVKKGDTVTVTILRGREISGNYVIVYEDLEKE